MRGGTTRHAQHSERLVGATRRSTAVVLLVVPRVRERIGDRRSLALVKAFLKSGILSEDGALRDTVTGTPQGGILPPLPSDLALSVLDEHFAAAWEAMGASHAREQRRRN